MGKFFINIGFARSGTTTLHHYFKNTSATVPKYEKEIKAFYEDINKEAYLKNFDKEDSSDSIFFESSPQYAHLATPEYKKVIDRIALALGKDDVNIVINLREPISRAFSNYWHNIGSHHSVFGRFWSVKNTDDAKRFRSCYDFSFYDAISRKKMRDNFFPDYADIIKYAINIFGKNKVHVISINGLDSGVKCLFEKMNIEFNGKKDIHVNKSFRPRYYISRPGGGVYSIVTTAGDYLVRVPEGGMLILSDKFCEVIRQDRYDLNEIFCASSHWTDSINTTHVRKIMGDYFKRQVQLFKDIPDSCFLNGCADDFLEKSFEDKFIDVSNSNKIPFGLEGIEELEVLSKC